VHFLSSGSLCKRRYSDTAFLGQRLPMNLDALDFVQRIGGEIALPAVRQPTRIAARCSANTIFMHLVVAELWSGCVFA